MPTLVSRGMTWVSVSAAGSHTCGVTAGGGAYCWGNGKDGQLGNLWTEDRLVPTVVSGGLTWVSVSAGGYFANPHTCGVAIGGGAYCWGAGGWGLLGNGSTVDKLVPTLVSGG